MTQGKKMPAGVGSRGGLVREYLRHEIVTQLGTFAAGRRAAAGSGGADGVRGVLRSAASLGYMIAKGMLF